MRSPCCVASKQREDVLAGPDVDGGFDVAQERRAPNQQVARRQALDVALRFGNVAVPHGAADDERGSRSRRPRAAAWSRRGRDGGAAGGHDRRIGKVARGRREPLRIGIGVVVDEREYVGVRRGRRDLPFAVRQRRAGGDHRDARPGEFQRLVGNEHDVERAVGLAFEVLQALIEIRTRALNGMTTATVGLHATGGDPAG